MIDRASLLIICVTIVFVASIIADCIKSIVKEKKEEKELEYDLEQQRYVAPRPAENGGAVRGVIVESKEWMKDE